MTHLIEHSHSKPHVLSFLEHCVLLLEHLLAFLIPCFTAPCSSVRIILRFPFSILHFPATNPELVVSLREALNLWPAVACSACGYYFCGMRIRTLTVRLLFLLPFIVAGHGLLAQGGTSYKPFKPDIKRALFHEYIDKSQRIALRTDGRAGLRSFMKEAR